MQVYTTAPLEDPRDARSLYPQLEEIGYDGVFSFEAKHDPFLPLAVAAEHTNALRLGTAIAIAFARNPMNLANLAYGIQNITGGRFFLGLGSQVRPHIQHRFSMPWSKPAARMREIVLAIKAIFDCWEGKAELDFRGEFYRHTLMIPAFNPGPNPFGPPPILTGGFGPLMTEIAGKWPMASSPTPSTAERHCSPIPCPPSSAGSPRASAVWTTSRSSVPLSSSPPTKRKSSSG